MPSFGNHAIASVTPDSLKDDLRIATENLEAIRVAADVAKVNSEKELKDIEEAIAIAQKKLKDLNDVYSAESVRVEQGLKVIQADEIAAKLKLDETLKSLSATQTAFESVREQLQLVNAQLFEVQESLLSKIHEHEKMSLKYNKDIVQYKATVLELQGQSNNLAAKISKQENSLQEFDSAILRAEAFVAEVEAKKGELKSVKDELKASIKSLESVSNLLRGAQGEYAQVLRDIATAKRDAKAEIDARENDYVQRERLLNQREHSFELKLAKVKQFKAKLDATYPERILDLDL